MDPADEEDDAEMEVEEDVRWKDCENVFASAGDDGVVRVWRLETPAEGHQESLATN